MARELATDDLHDQTGLLLTCLWHIRDVDPERLLLTGQTRDGVYLVEDGEVVGAVNNFRFNDSPIELLGRITEIGAAELTLCREWNDYFNRVDHAAHPVPDFNMSTVSLQQSPAAIAARNAGVGQGSRRSRVRSCDLHVLTDTQSH